MDAFADESKMNEAALAEVPRVGVLKEGYVKYKTNGMLLSVTYKDKYIVLTKGPCETAQVLGTGTGTGLHAAWGRVSANGGVCLSCLSSARIGIYECLTEAHLDDAEPVLAIPVYTISRLESLEDPEAGTAATFQVRSSGSLARLKITPW